jgi:hypothetical protein
MKYLAGGVLWVQHDIWEWEDGEMGGMGGGGWRVRWVACWFDATRGGWCVAKTGAGLEDGVVLNACTVAVGVGWV